ncbi:hypothetical protein LTR78_008596 [Recurvomyces mirabilis]|uniref:Uncharacterized protein n=1 Tax=Recurvomyces mirabilis TaxID=574656 RepID=A0AAE0TUI5_9PEZI|nr:hypothetical protein LTR78_008596 [Recurvomyces mirabilis]
MPPYLPDPENLADFDDDLLPKEDRVDEYANGHWVVPRNRQYNNRRKQASRQGRYAGDRHRRPNRGNRHTLVPGQFNIDVKKDSTFSHGLEAQHEEMAAQAKQFSAKIGASNGITMKPAVPATIMADGGGEVFQAEDHPIGALVKRAIEIKPTVDDNLSEPPAFNFVAKKSHTKTAPTVDFRSSPPEYSPDRCLEIQVGKAGGDAGPMDHLWKDMAPSHHPRASSPAMSSSSASNPFASSVDSGMSSSSEDDTRKARNMLDRDENFLFAIADDSLDPKILTAQHWPAVGEAGHTIEHSQLSRRLSLVRRTSVGSTFIATPIITKGQQGSIANQDESDRDGDDREDPGKFEIDVIDMMDDWDLLEEEVVTGMVGGYEADDECEITKSAANSAWPTADNGQGRQSWARWLGFRSDERAF